MGQRGQPAPGLGPLLGSEIPQVFPRSGFKTSGALRPLLLG
jgi:hypothetical protein